MKLHQLTILFTLFFSTALANNETIVQKVHFYSPNVGKAYLVWGVNDWQIPDSSLIDANTDVVNGLLYTPMNLEGDSLTASLSLPVNTKFHFMFWMTETREGHYIDTWDTNQGKNYQELIGHKNPIVVAAKPVTQNLLKKKSLLTHGWIGTFVLLTIFLVLSRSMRNRQVTHGYGQKTVCLGLSLCFLHYLIRIEVIGFGMSWVVKHPTALPITLHASIPDFLYMGSMTIVFFLFISLARKSTWQKYLYFLFAFIGFFSLLAALLNIKTIAYLGKPFTYQWLYYSDFLASTEAWQAFVNEGSMSLVLNIIALGIAGLVLSKTLSLVYAFFINSGCIKAGRAISGTAVLAISVLYVLPHQNGIDLGKIENPVLAFVTSYFTANTDGHFFSMPIPDTTFSPKRGTPITNLLPDDRDIKNVVVIVLESAGAEYFDLYGGNYGLRPDLSRFSENAVWFENAYAHAPTTSKSMVSLLCSMYPWISFKTLTQEYPGLEMPSISSTLKDHGYRTSFFTSSDLTFLQMGKFLSNRGFDTIEDYNTITCGQQFKLVSDYYHHGDGIDDICLADRFNTWLEEDSASPFFSLLWTVQGHYPYFISGDEKDFNVGNPTFNRYLNALQRDLDMVDQVLNQLKTRNLDSSTLVVIMGDHGESFGRHSQSGHASNIYEENLRIPLLFINPLLFSGQKSHQLAGVKDIASTINGILKLPTPENWQGRDLLSSESDEMYFFASLNGYRFGYRKGNLKFIYDELEGTSEVYDLAIDPREEKNIKDVYADSIPSAREAIGSWVQFQQRYIEALTRQN